MKYQFINGEIKLASEARIPTNDLGLLRGYAVFDYFRVLQGVPVFVEDHLDRLFHSLDVMDLELPRSREEIKQQIYELIEKNEMTEAGFRIVVSGGYAEDGFTPSTPNMYMMMHTLPTYSPSLDEKGAKLLTSAYQRDVPSVKTTIYVQSIHFAKKMKKENAIEVLYHWKGNITECSRSNIFFVDQNDNLITPKHGMLKGITRKRTIAVAESLGIPVQLRKVNMDEVPQMKEAFITSSTKEVTPIVQIDDLRIGDGRVGPMTKRIIRHFKEMLHAELDASVGKSTHE